MYFKSLALLLAVALAGGAGAEELVRNGDFENGLAPWTCAQRSGGKLDLHELSLETKSGKTCLRVTGDPDNKYNSFIALIQPLPQLDRDTEYILRVKARPAVSDHAGKEFKVAIRQADDKNAGLGYTGFTLNLAEDGWRNYEMRIKPDRRAASYAMYVIGSKLNRADAVFIDDVSLTPAVETAVPFDPAKTVNAPGRSLRQDGFDARIDDRTGLLSRLEIDGRVIQPGAENAVMVFVRRGDREILLDGRGTVSPDGAFRARAEYGFADGFLREVITVEALKASDAPVRVGVRHGFVPGDWRKIVGALRPLRVIAADRGTIFSYGENPDDLNLGDLDQYQHVAYPMALLENDRDFLLAGSRNLDGFVTLAPNQPAGYFPSLQQNPKQVKAGDRFRFETNWKLFPKAEYRLRDLWRYYCDRLQTTDPALTAYIPPRFTGERCFYPGPFGSHTYFVKAREERLRPGTNIWFYSWHDNLAERYPVNGEWWSAGNNWEKKISAPELKKYVDYLQNEKKFNLIFYFRQLANLNQRGKAFPDDWYRRTPGGALHLYGGGYQVKLPPQVAAEAGYDKIPLGQYNFANPAYRDFYHDEIFKAIRYYQPRAIGWDMGGDLNEFLTIARTYTTIRDEKLPVKVAANESAGPTQPYSDMVLLENGLLGGKSAYDFEVVRAYSTSVVCLERFNLFTLAVKANRDGQRTWLAPHGLAENKRYLDDLLKRRPELAGKDVELGRLCQLRGSLYDLGMGASPGYLEEAQPVPESLMRFAGDVNGLYAVNRSFVLKFQNRLDVDGRLAASAWQNRDSLRLAVVNDDAVPARIGLRLDRAYFASLGWTREKLASARAMEVTPEGEKAVAIRFSDEGGDLLLEAETGSFAALLIFAGN